MISHGFELQRGPEQPWNRFKLFPTAPTPARCFHAEVILQIFISSSLLEEERVGQPMRICEQEKHESRSIIPFLQRVRTHPVPAVSMSK